MYIESEDHLDRSADEVYPLVRDEMPRLLPYMPDVEALEQLSYERESETRVRIVNRWQAKASVPSLVEKFLPKDMFTWIDRAYWKDDEYCVDYVLEGFGYTAKGTNYFTPDGGGTKLRVTAEITIDPSKFKIPKLLFNKAFPMIEGSVRKAVQPNLTALARGLRDYFAAQGK
ncbi:MAG: hypothetical protein AMXMBFR64_01510 [Myxococcales bacterium]